MLQMWSGLNALNHGAAGFLHHDRHAGQDQGTFGKKSESGQGYYMTEKKSE